MESGVQDGGARLNMNAVIAKSRESRLKRRIATYEQQVQQLRAQDRHDTKELGTLRGDIEDEAVYERAATILRRRNDARHLADRRCRELEMLRAQLANVEVAA
jgi:hypothetical protein